MQAFGELKLTSPYITGMNASVLRTQLIKNGVEIINHSTPRNNFSHCFIEFIFWKKSIMHIINANRAKNDSCQNNANPARAKIILTKTPSATKHAPKIC